MTVSAKAVFAQGADTKVVWDNRADCSSKNSSVVAKNHPSCSLASLKNTRFYIIAYERVTVAVGVIGTVDHIKAAIQVNNDGAADISLDPGLAFIAVYKNEADFFADGLPKVFSPISAKEAKEREKNRVSGVRASTVESGVRPAFQAATNRDSRTGEITVSPKNDSTSQINSRRPGDETSSVSIKYDSVYNHPLTTQQVPVGKKTAGYIFFKPKKKPFRVLSILVGNVRFLFPIDQVFPVDPLSGK
jgi:hypothetical protein